MFFTDVFIRYIYQPFFNLLVFTYNMLEIAFPGSADMGVAVIIFTIIFRIILLPLSWASDRSENEKHEIAEKFEQIKKKYAHDPIKFKEEKNKLFRVNKMMVTLETFDIFVQVIIIIMLWRIFAVGLEGADMHLLYKSIKTPENINMMFLGKYNLGVPNMHINIINSLILFVVEILNVYFSPYKLSRIELLTPIILPIGVYFYMSTMPAGKKLFMITTLLFTLGIILTKKSIYYTNRLREKLGYNKKSEQLNGKSVASSQ